jgi:PTH1 family peptidyl-tRNA hydrolase
MFVIAGLQNPGALYEHTRHNVGAIALRAFQESCGLPDFVQSSAYAGELSEGVMGESDVRLILPTTYMNKSGTAVRKALGDESTENVIIVHDDLDLTIGECKISAGKGSGGHNGVASIEAALGSRDFVRVRIGIAPRTLFGAVKRPSGERSARFVLQKFTRREYAKIDALLPTVTDVLRTIVASGADAAMREYN